MTTAQRPDKPAEIRPWYREPWPWVAIAIPAVAVIMGAITFYLAVKNPDYLVIDEQQYREIKSELQAQSTSDSAQPGQDASRDQDDGDH
jgi:hypothetical protein